MKLYPNAELRSQRVVVLVLGFCVASEGVGAPRNGGIHRVGNPGESVAISVHLYGPRIEEVDGRDYDPSDYVGDRWEV